MNEAADHRHIEQAPITGPSSQEVAAMILAGFDRHYALFRYGAQRAKALFESGDWHGIQRLSQERIEYYDMRVRECIQKLQRVLPLVANQGPEANTTELSAEQQAFWQQIKQEYVALLTTHRQPECAETFFNSVSCRVLHRDYFLNDFLFVRPAVATDYLDSERPAYRVYYPDKDGLKRSLLRMVADFGLATPFEDLPRDVSRLARSGVRHLADVISRTGASRVAPDCQVHVLGTLFFRNKGAYIIGRVINQGTIHPFAIALVRSPAGQVCLDALLVSDDDLSRLFSFTRAYFLVDMEVPAAYVQFIGSLLPRKPKAEIYTMIGLQKQGKTLFYRDFLQHLSHSHDHFDIAPGIKGMVMCVFTLPSYPYVFKLIKDRIAKDGMDQETVKRKYQMVKLHDRVGRLADTWEYSQVALPRKRFSVALLQELRKEVPSLLEETPDTIIIRHVYIERRMTPLNLYLQHATEPHRERAVREYGQAIRELAIANIFPGDMLYKNFGVTRLGRIVFYDYDEIQRMTEMQFRDIPPAPNEEAEMSSEPWYAIGPNDVFPEEFGAFLLGDDRIRAVFMKHHAELLTAAWWKRCRDEVSRGRIADFFPYDPNRRLQSPKAPAARIH